ncbi:MAG: phosphoribosylanthranilate isomerase [Verrucomicrobia bacterium]|nr:phosphoribosylanthranilate isomerase [Verrucomicrobiota bacterium]
MIIKVCGMREPENIRAVERTGIDWMGFIFWPRSGRYVSAPPSYLPQKAKRAGVFVDADADTIKRHVADYALDIVQLHGHESPEYLRSLRSVFSGSAPLFIKAFSIADDKDLRRTAAYEGIADYFLFDTKTPLPGGSGMKFDWSVLSAYTGRTPFLLSGGIGPDDAPRVRSFKHEKLAGIDLNSRFETAPAMKDVDRLARFLSQL